MAENGQKVSDLRVRTLSAIVMLAVAGGALWLGGIPFAVFVALIALAVLVEWWGLVRRFASGLLGRPIWMIAGLAYVGVASASLIGLRLSPETGLSLVLWVLLSVIAVDVGAYFAGRTFGGPKIAPAISPSKTWAGLAGGVIGATAVVAAFGYWFRASFPMIGGHDWRDPAGSLPGALLIGAIVAVTAQTGDFFESWMKRRAGVKDSGTLIPGHGGVFDRVDGMLAVFALIALTGLAQAARPA